MTPLQIGMMLHFYCRPFPYPVWSPAAHEALEWFRAEGLVIAPAGDLDNIRLSKRGEAYVEFLQALPLPEAVWRVPRGWDPQSQDGSIEAPA